MDGSRTGESAISDSRNREMKGVIEKIGCGWLAFAGDKEEWKKGAHNADRGEDSQSTDG